MHGFSVCQDYTNPETPERFGRVPQVGFEPTRLTSQAWEASASTDFATEAENIKTGCVNSPFWGPEHIYKVEEISFWNFEWTGPSRADLGRERRCSLDP